jgi:hypothetical protein
MTTLKAVRGWVDPVCIKYLSKSAPIKRTSDFDHATSVADDRRARLLVTPRSASVLDVETSS